MYYSTYVAAEMAREGRCIFRVAISHAHRDQSRHCGTERKGPGRILGGPLKLREAVEIY